MRARAQLVMLALTVVGASACRPPLSGDEQTPLPQVEPEGAEASTPEAPVMLDEDWSAHETRLRLDTKLVDMRAAQLRAGAARDRPCDAVLDSCEFKDPIRDPFGGCFRAHVIRTEQERAAAELAVGRPLSIGEIVWRSPGRDRGWATSDDIHLRGAVDIEPCDPSLHRVKESSTASAL